MKICKHVSEAREVTAHTDGCEECLKLGMEWVHLRACLSCGHVGCCDQSEGKHATGHFHKTAHPIMRSYQPDEDWGWCFVDELEFDGSALPLAIRAPSDPSSAQA